MPLISSYSQHSKFYHCPYSHHLYRDVGIINTASNEDTTFGSTIHSSIERMLRDDDLTGATLTISEGVKSIPGLTMDGFPRSKELEWLGQGLLLAFNKWALPSLREIYEVESIEQEFTIPLTREGVADPANAVLLWATRPDALLLRKSDKRVFNCNIKTSGFMGNLGEIYEFSIQILMESLAIKLHKGVDTGGTIILALNKGQKGKPNKQDKAKGKVGYRRDSPLTYVWAKNNTLTWQWSAGAEKVGVWTLASTPQEWFDQIPEDVQKAQVMLSLPIEHSKSISYPDVIRDIVDIETSNLRAKNLDACNSYGTFNKPCDYKLWCHGTAQERQDNFQPRLANHPIEDLDLGGF
jgi:hypothetical protein